MKGALLLFGIVLLLGVATACSVSKNPWVHLLGGMMFGVMSLATSAFTLFLVSVGARNNWSSDGPGMLMIMIGIGVLGFVSLGGWMITANVLAVGSAEEGSRE